MPPAAGGAGDAVPVAPRPGAMPDPESAMATPDTPETAPGSAAPKPALATAVDIFAAPGEAFAALRRRPAFWFPLLLLIGANAAAMLWYHSILDYDWYVDDLIAQSNVDNEETIEAMRLGLEAQSPFGIRAGVTVVGSTITFVVLFSVQALYLTLVSAIAGDGHRFRHWFSLACWSSLPALVSIAGMLATIALSPNGQLSVYDLDPLSLRNLGAPADSGVMENLASFLSLSSLWSLALLMLGYRHWLECGWFRAAAVVLTPWALVLGALALLV